MPEVIGLIILISVTELDLKSKVWMLSSKLPISESFVLLMNPDHDKIFGWNFFYLLNSPNGTIEFRRGAASTSVFWMAMLCQMSRLSDI